MTQAMGPALEIRRLSKTFGGQKALREVDFSLLPGEVHGLLGQNGSGKSTLIKVLAGFHEPDPGATLSVFGQDVPLPVPPGEFRRLELSFVHQTLGLVPSLTVLENLLLPRLSTSRAWRIDWAAERAAARATLARYNLDIDPSAPLSRLSSVERALVAIVRAVEEIGARRGVLVLDEPTPFLPRRDVERLFAMIRRIAAGGSAVVFVSHDIDEVREITDRATVLRDGQVAGTLVTQAASREAFVRMIIGRDLDAAASRPARAVPAPTVVLSGLSGGQVEDLTIALAPGEIVGITGLLGAGYEQVPYLAYGALPATSGTLELPGHRLGLADLSPAAALEAGLVLIPADRPVAGGVGALPVVDNVTLPALSRRFRPWLLRRGQMLRVARDLNAAFGVTPNRPELTLSALSGGNQQKVILAKWLQLQPILVLLDEPTQGVDVGARQLVFRAIRAAAQNGACVLCASSDADQLAEICDRVLVLARGRLAAEITPPALSKHAIVAQCYQVAA
ncbi:MAG: sugar ABC transporter ATP-binding protein [Rhodopila sp.]